MLIDNLLFTVESPEAAVVRKTVVIAHRNSFNPYKKHFREAPIYTIYTRR